MLVYMLLLICRYIGIDFCILLYKMKWMLFNWFERKGLCCVLKNEFM